MLRTTLKILLLALFLIGCDNYTVEPNLNPAVNNNQPIQLTPATSEDEDILRFWDKGETKGNDEFTLERVQ